MSAWRLMLTGALRNPVRVLLSVLCIASAVWALGLVRSLSSIWQQAAGRAADDVVMVRSASTRQARLPADAAAKIRAADGEITELGCRVWADAWQATGRPRRLALDTTLGGGMSASAEATTGAATAPALGSVTASTELLRSLGWTSDKPLHLRLGPDRREREVTLHSGAPGGGVAVRATQITDPAQGCDELHLRVSQAALAPSVARKIDALFADGPQPTISETARDAERRQAESLGALFRLVDALSLLLLAIIGAVVAALLGVATAERTTEYAVMRALGFEPAYIIGLVCIEAVVLAAAGALLGVLAAVVSLHTLVARLSAQMPELLPEVAVAPGPLGLAFFAACTLAALASLVPAITASRVAAAHALRQQG